MTARNSHRSNTTDLSAVGSAFHNRFADAAKALKKSLKWPATVEVDGLEVLPIQQFCKVVKRRVGIAPDTPIRCCMYSRL
jgi:hypothetical protein